MAGVSSITRSSEWWSYKIPPILAVGYAYLLLTEGSQSPYVSVGLIFAVMTSIIAVAAYGYVINDCFDVEQDRLAGKSNSMANRSIPSRFAILALILGVGWLPAFLAGYSKLACIFLAIDFLLPTLYSIPPIRLKERGVFGVIADAGAAHLFPVLLVSAVMLMATEPLPLSRMILIATTAAWYTLVGLRGIIDHQLVDREADIKSGVVTLATARGMIRILKWARRILYIFEMVSFATLVVILGMSTYSIFPVVFVFGSLEIIKRSVGWVERDPSGGKRLYLPFANNIVYSLWIPIALAMEIGLRNPWLLWLPVLHIVLFSRGRQHDYAELYRLRKDFNRKLRRIYNQRVYGWDVFADHSLWPRMSLLSHRTLRVVPAAIVGSQNPWDVRIISNRYPLAAGMSYQLRLRLRSDQPRELTVGVCQRFPTFRDLGLAEVIPVNHEWEDFYFDFTANFTEQNAGIFIWLGAREIPVEIEEARLVCVTSPGPWRLMLTRPAEAWRSRPEDQSYLVKIDRIQSDGDPWKVKLTGCNYTVCKGQLYRVQVSVRSSGNRPLTFGVARSYAPFDVMGLCESIIVQDDFQEFQADFIAEQDETVNIFFWLGGASSAVEVLNADLRAINVSRVWSLSRKDGFYAWRVATDDPERVVLDIAEQNDKVLVRSEQELSKAAWDVTIRTPIQAIQKGRRYWVSLSMRAVNERRVTLAICQGNSPWATIGLCERVTLLPEWKQFYFDFEATESDARPYFTLAVGEVSSLVDFVGLEIFGDDELSDDTNHLWKIEHNENNFVRRLPSKSKMGIGLEVIPSNGEGKTSSPWNATAFKHLGEVTESNWYRLRFRGFAIPASSVVFLVGQNRKPWEQIGFYREVTLQEVSQQYAFDFCADRSELESLVRIALGNTHGVIDVGDVALERISDSDAWQWNNHKPCDARFYPIRPGTIRIESIVTDKNSWHVQLVGPPREMRRGEVYRWNCRFVADARRKIAFGTRQTIAPYETIGLWKELKIGPVGQDVSIEFTVPKGDIAIIPFILLGQSNVPVEVIDYSLELIGTDPLLYSAMEVVETADETIDFGKSGAIDTTEDLSDEQNAVTEG